jgi:hypothetical protein
MSKTLLEANAALGTPFATSDPVFQDMDDPDVGYEPWAPPPTELKVNPLPDEDFVPAPGGAAESEEVPPEGSGPVSSVRNSGTPTTDALLKGLKWGGPVGTAVTVEYSFPDFGATWAVDYDGLFDENEPHRGFERFHLR